MEKNRTNAHPIFEDDYETEVHGKMTIDVTNVDDATSPDTLKIDKNKFHTFGSEEARAMMNEYRPHV